MACTVHVLFLLGPIARMMRAACGHVVHGEGDRAWLFIMYLYNERPRASGTLVKPDDLSLPIWTGPTADLAARRHHWTQQRLPTESDGTCTYLCLALRIELQEMPVPAGTTAWPNMGTFAVLEM